MTFFSLNMMCENSEPKLDYLRTSSYKIKQKATNNLGHRFMQVDNLMEVEVHDKILLFVEVNDILVAFSKQHNLLHFEAQNYKL